MLMMRREMPPAFISSPARMKNGTASSGKLSAPAWRFCASNCTSQKSRYHISTAPVRISAKAIGMPNAMKPNREDRKTTTVMYGPRVGIALLLSGGSVGRYVGNGRWRLRLSTPDIDQLNQRQNRQRHHARHDRQHRHRQWITHHGTVDGPAELHLVPTAHGGEAAGAGDHQPADRVDDAAQQMRKAVTDDAEGHQLSPAHAGRDANEDQPDEGQPRKLFGACPASPEQVAQYYAAEHHDHHEGQQGCHQPIGDPIETLGNPTAINGCGSQCGTYQRLVSAINRLRGKILTLGYGQTGALLYPPEDFIENRFPRLSGIDYQHAGLAFGGFKRGELAVHQGNRHEMPGTAADALHSGAVIDRQMNEVQTRNRIAQQIAIAAFERGTGEHE